MSEIWRAMAMIRFYAEEGARINPASRQECEDAFNVVYAFIRRFLK